MQNETHYQRNPNFIYRKIVDESVLVPIHKDVADMDAIYSLNSIGSFIWEHFDAPGTQNDLITAILHEYDADPDVLKADLKRFLDEMLALGALLEV